MSEINWNELKDKAHSNAVKHGFWEGRPSDKHFLCLVISELMEAVNAHRRNKFARVPANRKETIFDDRTFHHENKYFRENFEEYVKDTVEDELADAAIRLLDLAGANVKGRIKFYRPDGTQGDSPGCGSVLIAFGEENAKILEYSNIPGKYIKLNN